MTTSKIAIGTKVISAKYGVGEIIKVITKSTGYIEVKYATRLQKEMSFNLTDENGVSLKAKPKAAEVKPLTPAEQLAANINTWKNIAMAVNDKWNSNSTWKLAESEFGKVNANGNDFIESLLHSMFFKNYLSEKQAYCLARFAVETNQLS